MIALDPDGSHEVVVSVPSFPMCIDFLPDGRLLVVDSAQRRLLRREQDGSLVEHADLSGISEKPWNDIVVDDRGNAYVNTIGFDFPGGEFAPGSVVRVAPGGAVDLVADGLAFPNGIAITPDNATLIVAESYANRLTAFDIATDGHLENRRVWAETPEDHPDGICMDVDGAVWYADVGNIAVYVCLRAVRCWRPSASTAAPSHARSVGATTHSCSSLARTGGPDSPQPSGQVVAFAAPAQGAGRP